MEPYIVNGKNVPLKMRYGSSEAKATMFEDEYGRARSKSVPGKPVIFTMDWETGHKAVIMPEGAARMYFGHWDIPEVSEADTAPWQNTKFERERVATNWGGYTTASLDSDNKKNYILPYIAAPNVPHVLISDVNDNGEEGMLMFDPWERYRWNDYVTPLHALSPSMQLPPGFTNPNSAKAMQQPVQTPGLITVSEAQLRDLIANGIAAALGSKKAS
jgi:hypothetical protein